MYNIFDIYCINIFTSEGDSHGIIFPGGFFMLENYIDQIITMGTLADSVTIIDDQQIIRHFQPFNPDIVPFTASDVVGTHFRSTFLDVDPADSGVLRALHGESTISRAYTHLLFNGQRSSGIESIFPIRMGDSIIGSISVSRFLSRPNRFLDVKDDPSVSPDLAEIPDMIGNSPAMQTLKRQILRVARTDANVLICGETGTGKELVAHAVHTASPRCKRLFYPQNCAAHPLISSGKHLFWFRKRGIHRLRTLQRDPGAGRWRHRFSG